MVKTETLFVPTWTYKQNYSSGDLANESDDVQYYWNSYIADSNNYEMTTYDDWDIEIDLRNEDIPDISDARDAAAEYLENNYPSLIDTYDAFMVLDDREYDSNGYARVGSTSNQAAGGSDQIACTGYVCEPGGATGQHEMGHLYSGRHVRCRLYTNTANYHTVMASFGHTDHDCEGKDFEWSNRAREFYTCVVNDVQDYMDYWNQQNGSFSEDDGSGSCFITTATVGYGQTRDELSQFRDSGLQPSTVGNLLVNLYYSISPPIANELRAHPQSKITRFLRWYIIGCGYLATLRNSTHYKFQKQILTVILTGLYIVGVLFSIFGYVLLSSRQLLQQKGGED